MRVWLLLALLPAALAVYKPEPLPFGKATCLKGAAVLHYLNIPEVAVDARPGETSLGASLTTIGRWTRILTVKAGSAGDGKLRLGSIIVTVCGTSVEGLRLADVAARLSLCLRSEGKWILGVVHQQHFLVSGAQAAQGTNVLKLAAVPVRKESIPPDVKALRKATCLTAEDTVHGLGFAYPNNLEVLPATGPRIPAVFNQVKQTVATVSSTRLNGKVLMLVVARAPDPNIARKQAQQAAAQRAAAQRQGAQKKADKNIDGKVFIVRVMPTEKGTLGIGLGKSHLKVNGSPHQATVVTEVVPGSAQFHGTLLRGDVILKIHNTDVRKLEHTRLAALLARHSQIKKFTLSVFRPKDPAFFLPPSMQQAPAHSGPIEPYGYTLNCSFSAPFSAQRHFPCAHAEFGAPLPWKAPIEMAVGLVAPPSGCSRTGSTVSAGLNFFGDGVQHKRRFPWWALVSRGDCFFHVKAQHAQAYGASGVIVINSANSHLEVMGFPSQGVDVRPLLDSIRIPVVMIGWQHGEQLRAVVRDTERLAGAKRHNATTVSFAFHAQKPTKQEEFRLNTAFPDGQFSLAVGKVGYPSGSMADSKVDVKVSMLEMMRGKVTTTTVGRMRLCPHCKGRGGPPKAIMKCPMCAGHTHDGQPAGTLQWESGLSNTTSQTREETCPACQGTKEWMLPMHRCRHCEGKRVLKNNKAFKLRLPPGAPDGYRQAFPKEGSEAYMRSPGALVFVFSQQPDSTFTRDGVDLLTAVNITLKEALAGFETNVTLPNGHVVPINRTGMTEIGTVVRVPGVGFPMFDASDPGAYDKWETQTKAARERQRLKRFHAHQAQGQGLPRPPPDCSHCGPKDHDCLQDCMLEGGEEEEEEDIDVWPHGDLVVSLNVVLPSASSNASEAKRSAWKKMYNTGQRFSEGDPTE